MNISDAEWAVMNLVWEKSPIDAAEVVERVGKPNKWTAATVKTMLHRLVRKGALATESQGRRYLYRPAVKRDKCVRLASRSFLDRVCGGQAAPALLHLVDAAELSAAEAAAIRKLLDEKLGRLEGSKE